MSEKMDAYDTKYSTTYVSEKEIGTDDEQADESRSEASTVDKEVNDSSESEGQNISDDSSTKSVESRIESAGSSIKNAASTAVAPANLVQKGLTFMMSKFGLSGKAITAIMTVASSAAVGAFLLGSPDASIANVVMNSDCIETTANDTYNEYQLNDEYEKDAWGRAMYRILGSKEITRPFAEHEWKLTDSEDSTGGVYSGYKVYGDGDTSLPMSMAGSEYYWYPIDSRSADMDLLNVSASADAYPTLDTIDTSGVKPKTGDINGIDGKSYESGTYIAGASIETVIGMIACADCESGVLPSSFEGNMKALTTEYKGHTSSETLAMRVYHHYNWDKYCEAMFNSGYETTEDAYKYNDHYTGDEHLYPGLGLWGYTGPLAYEYQEFCDTFENPWDINGDGSTDAMYTLSGNLAFLIYADDWLNYVGQRSDLFPNASGAGNTFRVFQLEVVDGAKLKDGALMISLGKLKETETLFHGLTLSAFGEAFPQIEAQLDQTYADRYNDSSLKDVWKKTMDGVNEYLRMVELYAESKFASYRDVSERNHLYFTRMAWEWAFADSEILKTIQCSYPEWAVYNTFYYSSQKWLYMTPFNDASLNPNDKNEAGQKNADLIKMKLTVDSASRGAYTLQSENGNPNIETPSYVCSGNLDGGGRVYSYCQRWAVSEVRPYFIERENDYNYIRKYEPNAHCNMEQRAMASALYENRDKNIWLWDVKVEVIARDRFGRIPERVSDPCETKLQALKLFGDDQGTINSIAASDDPDDMGTYTTSYMPENLDPEIDADNAHIGSIYRTRSGYPQDKIPFAKNSVDEYGEGGSPDLSDENRCIKYVKGMVDKKYANESIFNEYNYCKVYRINRATVDGDKGASYTDYESLKGFEPSCTGDKSRTKSWITEIKNANWKLARGNNDISNPYQATSEGNYGNKTYSKIAYESRVLTSTEFKEWHKKWLDKFPSYYNDSEATRLYNEAAGACYATHNGAITGSYCHPTCKHDHCTTEVKGYDQDTLSGGSDTGGEDFSHYTYCGTCGAPYHITGGPCHGPNAECCKYKGRVAKDEYATGKAMTDARLAMNELNEHSWGPDDKLFYNVYMDVEGIGDGSTWDQRSDGDSTSVGGLVCECMAYQFYYSFEMHNDEAILKKLKFDDDQLAPHLQPASHYWELYVGTDQLCEHAAWTSDKCDVAGADSTYLFRSYQIWTVNDDIAKNVMNLYDIEATEQDHVPFTLEFNYSGRTSSSNFIVTLDPALFKSQPSIYYRPTKGLYALDGEFQGINYKCPGDTIPYVTITLDRTNMQYIFTVHSTSGCTLTVNGESSYTFSSTYGGKEYHEIAAHKDYIKTENAQARCGRALDLKTISSTAISLAWPSGYPELATVSTADAETDLKADLQFAIAGIAVSPETVTDPDYTLNKEFANRLCTEAYVRVKNYVFPEEDPTSVLYDDNARTNFVPGLYSSCDRGAATIVRASGVDPTFPNGTIATSLAQYNNHHFAEAKYDLNWTNMESAADWFKAGPANILRYCETSDLWYEPLENPHGPLVGERDDPVTLDAGNADKLRPGDILISAGSDTVSPHIVVFVGYDDIYDKFIDLFAGDGQTYTGNDDLIKYYEYPYVTENPGIDIDRPFMQYVDSDHAPKGSEVYAIVHSSNASIADTKENGPEYARGLMLSYKSDDVFSFITSGEYRVFRCTNIDNETAGSNWVVKSNWVTLMNAPKGEILSSKYYAYLSEIERQNHGQYDE